MNFLAARSVEEFLGSNPVSGDELWVFHHLPKTAGSSVVAQFSEALKPNRTVDAYATNFGLSYDQSIDLAFMQFARETVETRYRFVTGHFERHHIQWFLGDRRTRLFALLRDPLTRTISEYRYQQTSAHPDHQRFIARYPSFDHYIRDERRRNPMVRAIAGREDAAAAIAIVENDYLFCGTTEFYDQCLALIFTMIGAPDVPATVYENVTAATVPNEVARPEIYRPLVRALNRADSELYEHVRGRISRLLK